MKKKPVTILLLIAAIAIWGMVGWRIVAGLTNENKFLERPSTIKEVAFEEDNFRDTFEIRANYPDPFLGGWPRKQNTTSQKKVKKSIKKEIKTEPPKEPPVDWSFIEYKGQIKSKKGKKIGLVSIKGEDLIVNEGMNIKDIIIKKITPDSIQVLYNKKLKYILSK